MDKYILNGHNFDTIEEYELAKREKKGVAFVCSQMDLTDINKVRSVYTEISEKNIFKTVIGTEFMNRLREILGEDKVDDYSNLTAATREPEADKTEVKDKPVAKETSKPASKLTNSKDQKSKEDKKYLKTKEKLFTSIVLNVIMAIIIAIMLYIASTSNSINIINYETKLQDKYSSWAEDLKERESQLREIEKEIENSNSQN